MFRTPTASVIDRARHQDPVCRVAATALPALALTLSLIVPPAFAQPQGPPQWWALDSSPEGTPPTIQLDPSASSPQQTVLDVTIHGFYYQTILAQGETFRRLSFEKTGIVEPDMAQYRTVGRPELPALHHMVGLLVGNLIGPNQDVQVIEEIQIPNALIYPAQIEQTDHEGDPPPPFQWDVAFYQQTTSPYPVQRAHVLGARGRIAGMNVGATETYPFRYVPAARTLLVTKRLRLAIPHPGTEPPNATRVTQRQAARLAYTLENWSVIDDYRASILNGMAGDYLIITDPLFVDEIEPLADQKRWRNYSVIVATTDETGGTANQIRNYIVDWYEDTGSDRDHYCLLVGDVSDIPMCTDENGNPSDKLYACVDGLGLDGLPDPFPEVMLGRFSCDSGAECTDMVTKTLAYEDGFAPGSDWLDDVLLVAHEEAYDGYYQEAHEVVETADYVVQPVFHTAYGREGATNADVRDEVDAGRGVVAYRGHGTSTTWVGWSQEADDDFDLTDIGLLDNNERTPVVLSFACTNNDLGTSDCFGEKWMETTERAVAFHGSSVPSGTTANHVYDRETFDAIYNYDIFQILSEATAAAEVVMIEAVTEGTSYTGEYNAWIYLLLGDPELKVWREDVPPLMLAGYMPEVPTGPSTFLVQVVDGQLRSPVANAVVALYKDGEVADNRYTDENGWVEIPIDPETEGEMHLTAFTEFTRHGVASEVIEVLDPAADASDPAAATLVLQLAPAQPNPMSKQGVLRYALPRAGRVGLSIFDAAGRRVIDLVDEERPAGWNTVAWYGRDANGRAVPGGVYFSRLSFEGRTRMGRLQIVH